MSKRKPRIEIRVVSPDGTAEFSTVEGRPLVGGGTSIGPTEEQYRIAHLAILELAGAPIPEALRTRHRKAT